MVLLRKELKQKVEAKLKKTTIKELTTYMKKKEISLWGQDKGKKFEGDCLLLALYHDLYGIGYNKIEQEIKNWRPLSAKSIRHNTKEVRKVLSGWSDKQLVLGDFQDWKYASKKLSETEAKEGVNLLVDSSDFKKLQPVKHSLNSPEHSFKENHYANRFTCIFDMKQRARVLYGPYSPKVDDNSFVRLMKPTMEESMKGAVILGDCGYSAVAKEFQKIKMITTISKPRGRVSKDGSGIRQLTKVQKTKNKMLKKLRSRVESPFGIIKQRWKTLSTCFMEDETQHGLLVKLALATYNFQLKK